MNKVLLFFLFAFSFFCKGQQNNLQGAVLDLSSHNFNETPVLSLSQDWEFYYNKLLAPDDFKKAGSAAPFALVKPLSWADIKLNGQSIANTGCATYRIVVLHPPKEALALDAYSIQSAYRVFVNGQLRAEVGKPGTTKENTAPMNRDVQIQLPYGADTLEIVVQVANFHHRKGGFVHAFELGKSESIQQQRVMYYLLDVLESSALAIIGLFLFALFIFRRKDLSVLYFSLFCISLSFRPVIAVNYLLSYLFSGISWSLMLKMEYLAVVLPCLFMVLFIKKLFDKQLSSLFVKIFLFVFSAMALIVLFCPPSVFSWLVLPVLLIIPLGAVVFTVTIIRAILAKVEGARYAGIGLITLLCSLILKVMVYAGIIHQVHVLITLLDIAFIFMMSLILGSRFSIQFSKVERLQRKTEAQHEEIQKQKMEVERQKDILEEKNKAIIDSINYAKRIQQTLMTNQRYIEKSLKNLRKK